MGFTGIGVTFRLVGRLNSGFAGHWRFLTELNTFLLRGINAHMYDIVYAVPTSKYRSMSSEMTSINRNQ